MNKELCMEHSGVLEGINTLKKDVAQVQLVEIPAINKSIVELKIYIAKTTALAIGAIIALEKIGVLK